MNKSMIKMFKTWLRAAPVCVLLMASLTHAALEGTPTYYHNNFSGSPIAATNAAGQLLWDTDYLPHGERYATGSVGETTNKVWFTGHVEDRDTSLVYMEARYYDPEVGRFYGVDPVGFVEGNRHSFNRYSYGNNNPYRFVDPNGMEAVDQWEAMGERNPSEAGARAAAQVRNGGAAIANGVDALMPHNAVEAILPWGIGKLFKWAKVANSSVTTEKFAAKIFGGRSGHLPDTPENRKLLESIAADSRTTLGLDRHGNEWSAKILEDGSQAWTQVRNGHVINGGLNKIPKEFNPETGLSAAQRPNWK